MLKWNGRLKDLNNMEKMYKILRFYLNKSKKPKLITINLTLKEAQEHCEKPKSKGRGWYDGYTEQHSFKV